MIITKTKLTAGAMALLAFASASARAEEDMSAAPLPGLHGSVGAGVAVMPQYEGAKDSKTRVLPNINLYYGDSLFFTRMTAGANLLRFTTEQGVAVTAGPILALRRGRDQDDNAALSGLGDIKRGLDAGGFVRLRKEGWHAVVDIRQNVTDADQGSTVNFNAGYSVPLSSNLRLRTNLDTTWASSEYMKTFFGVDTLQSAQSGIAQYEAGAGFKHIGAMVMADYSISREWAGFASLHYRRLLGDAAASPIVTNSGDRDQVSASIGVKYRF